MFIICFCPAWELCGKIYCGNKEIERAEMESRQAEKGHYGKTPSLNISFISRGIVIYKAYQRKNKLLSMTRYMIL